MKILTKTLTLIRLRCSAVVRLSRRVTFDRLGVEFPWNGDTVIWLWWWRRNGLPKYISVGFSGNGDFGDARFRTLAEIDKAWEKLGDYQNSPFSA
jgi:hypothetical protein